VPQGGAGVHDAWHKQARSALRTSSGPLLAQQAESASKQVHATLVHSLEIIQLSCDLLQ
jgi:hypothetical protein